MALRNTLLSPLTANHCRVTCLLLGAMISSGVALLTLTGCTGSTKPSHATPASSLTAQTFVGDTACAKCHPVESAKHANSNHARTLRQMDTASLAGLAPPFGPVPKSRIILKPADGRYLITAAGLEEHQMPLSLAFGSGKSGMTFVAFVDPRTLLEVRTSYFPREKRWYITPGQQHQPAENIGVFHSAPITKLCMGCHTVTLPADSLNPEPRFFGVGCEACHGPGGPHIAAISAGSSGVKMEKLGTWQASRLNEEVCGKCHRTEKSVAAQGHDADMTQRFQPYGIMKSRCFREGGKSLSCLTCHDPHSDASTDIAAYEAKCLSCHGASTAATTGSKNGKPCPVDAHKGCVHCHMPSRRIFTDTDLTTEMADHWIRVHR